MKSHSTLLAALFHVISLFIFYHQGLCDLHAHSGAALPDVPSHHYVVMLWLHLQTLQEDPSTQGKFTAVASKSYYCYYYCVLSDIWQMTPCADMSPIHVATWHNLNCVLISNEYRPKKKNILCFSLTPVCHWGWCWCAGVRMSSCASTPASRMFSLFLQSYEWWAFVLLYFFNT